MSPSLRDMIVMTVAFGIYIQLNKSGILQYILLLQPEEI